MSQRLLQANNTLRGLCRPAIAVVITLLLLTPGFATPSRSQDLSQIVDGIDAILQQPFYNIAHMTNTVDAVNWAISQGANAVEMDLQFDANGKPTEFRHGGSCDCSYFWLGMAPSDHVCSKLHNSCEVSSNPTQQLNHVARTNLALVYIDSKVNGSTHPNAGGEVIKLLEDSLFAAGFGGIVIVAAPDYFDYVNSAATRASSSAFKNRIYFTLDMDRGRTAQGTIDKLQELPTRNLVYSNGISGCTTPDYYEEIGTGVVNQIAGKVKLTGIWTVDQEWSMGEYISKGVRAIMTNKPGLLRQVLASKSIPLATPLNTPLFNIATGKSATQSSESWGGSASRAVDGNTNGNWFDNSVTHTAAEDSPWWQVDLGEDYSLIDIVVNNRTDCCTERLNDFRLEVRTAAGAVTKTYAHSGAAEQSTRVYAGVSGRYVKIILPEKKSGAARYLSLAEVQVLVAPYRNLALSRPTRQSSEAFGGSASRAVDGNTSGNWADNSVTHTGADIHPWWEVDLGSNQWIDKIIVYNRTDCCGDRLDNFTLQTVYDFGYGQMLPSYTYQHGGAAGQKIEIPVQNYARYVQISVWGPWFSPGHLSLAEVEVLARR